MIVTLVMASRRANVLVPGLCPLVTGQTGVVPNTPPAVDVVHVHVVVRGIVLGHSVFPAATRKIADVIVPLGLVVVLPPVVIAPDNVDCAQLIVPCAAVPLYALKNAVVPAFNDAVIVVGFGTTEQVVPVDFTDPNSIQAPLAEAEPAETKRNPVKANPTTNNLRITDIQKLPPIHRPTSWPTGEYQLSRATPKDMTRPHNTQPQTRAGT